MLHVEPTITNEKYSERKIAGNSMTCQFVLQDYGTINLIYVDTW